MNYALDPSTATQLTALIAAGAPWIEQHVPVVMRATLLGVALWQWLGVALAIVFAYLAGVVFAGVLMRVGEKLAARTSATWDDELIAAVRRPLRILLMVILMDVTLAPLGFGAAVRAGIGKTRAVAIICVAGWLASRMIGFFSNLAERMLTRGVEDPGRVRGVKTLVVILKRVSGLAVGIVAASLVLTQFEVARNVGSAVLASAGVATLVAGLAAQKSLSSLLAGLQIAITQPIRVGDTVIVENEWGWIEEITFSYVVVKVWDLRRLIVPISYFNEKPFQNWTKVAPDIMGTVEIPTDYAAPIDQVRKELERICKGHAKWDGKVCGLQITNVTDRTMLMRALVSSKDAGENWDLRCDVREGLIKFLQQLEHGRYLPRARVEVPAEAPRDSGVLAAASPR